MSSTASLTGENTPDKLTQSLQGSRPLARRLLIVVAVSLFLLATSWGVVFAYAERMVDIYPGSSATTNENQPTVTAMLRSVPAARLSAAVVTIDGKRQRDGVEMLPLGVRIRTLNALPDGKHEIEVKMRYSMLAPRHVTRKWSFVVDTVAPEVSVAGGSNYVVTDKDFATVAGVAEAGSRLRYVFNGGQETEVRIGKAARFSIALKGLRKENKLVMRATDAAGNTRSLVVPVLKDEDDPQIDGLSPAEGEVVRARAPKVAAQVTDGGSMVREAKLFIDDKLALTKQGESTTSIAYLGALLADGPHKARVEAADFAGHTSTKSWSFSIDSRRIVVDRGARRLYFYRNGGLYKVYVVAVGMPQYPTPRGSFRIVVKDRNPSWRNPGSPWAKDMPKVIPPGPGNPLGTRAMGLNYPAIFIHGTYASGSLGRAASHGCIRMSVWDSQQLFDMVGIGVPVEIIN